MGKAGKILAILAVLFIVAAPLWAADGSGTAPGLGDARNVNGSPTRNPFALPLSFFESIVLSAAAGGLVASKFIIDIVRAYMAPDREIETIKKAVIKFLITVFVVMFFSLLLMHVTGITSASTGSGYARGYLL